MNKVSILNIVMILLLIIIVVLLILFGVNILYMNKKSQHMLPEEHIIPKALTEPIIMCKNGHKFIIYKNQIVQILDTHNKPAICKDDSLHIDGE